MRMFLLGLILGIGLPLAYQQLKSAIATSSLVAKEPHCTCYVDNLDALARSMCMAPGDKTTVMFPATMAVLVHPRPAQGGWDEATTPPLHRPADGVDYW